MLLSGSPGNTAKKRAQSSLFVSGSTYSQAAAATYRHSGVLGRIDFRFLPASTSKLPFNTPTIPEYDIY